MRDAGTRADTEEYITRKELCRRLHVSPSTVYRHGLQDFAVLIGNAVRYDWCAIVDAYRMQADARKRDPKRSWTCQPSRTSDKGSYVK